MLPDRLSPTFAALAVFQGIFESEAVSDAREGGWSGAFGLLVEYAATP
jgi:hypothetical protein